MADDDEEAIGKDDERDEQSEGERGTKKKKKKKELGRCCVSAAMEWTEHALVERCQSMDRFLAGKSPDAGASEISSITLYSRIGYLRWSS